ncbi:MAG: hypothetical protein RBT16_14740, partial [Desulfococcus multivorans]|nr:hypothetical protein [Desulfococcus multivorans]
MFGRIQYTALIRKKPLQNALFLCIPVSYFYGWTLAKPFPVKESKSVVDRTIIKKMILFSVKKHDALLFDADDPITEADRIAKLE